MAVAAGRIRSQRPLWLPAALAVAALVGVVAAVHASYAFALVFAAGVALLVAADVRALPLFLVFTMFVEVLALGPGLRVGRLAGGLALVVLVLCMLRRGVAGLRPTPLLAVSGAYGIWLLASALWATSAGPVLSDFASYLLAIAYTLALAVFVRDRRQLRAVFGTLALGSSVFGLVAFATYSASAGGRAAGLQGDPNYFALYQVIALAPSLALATGERSPRRRLALYGVVVVVVLSVASSLSRSGLLALGLVVAATIALPWRLFFRARASKLQYALVVAVAAALAVVAGSSTFVARAQSILNGTHGGSGRTDLWRAALRGWHEHPWLGLGAGNYQVHALDLLQATPGVCTTCNYVAAGRVVHNAYLESLTELGPLGLALFVAVLVLCGRTLLQAARRARRAGDGQLERYAIALLVSLAGYCVGAFFLSNELSKALWILVGLALALEVTTRRLRPASAARAYHPGVLEGDEERGMLDRLVRDQERLDRRRAALDERERGLAERELALAAAATRHEQDTEVERLRTELERARLAHDEERRELEERLRAVEAVLASSRQALEEARSRLDERSDSAGIEEREARLEERIALVTRREQEIARRAGELALREREEAPAPEPPPAPPPQPERAAAEIRGRTSLDRLQELVDRHARLRPDRAEEWQAYLYFLREHAGFDGTLPETFDPLVDDVFGELLR